MARLLVVAACAMLDSDGRVLLSRRPKNKDMGGLWEFPGGKLAADETPERALVRELKEELGVVVDAACLAPFGFASQASGDIHLLMPLFLCRKWTGIPCALEEQELAWVRPGEFRNYPMLPADRPLAAQLRDFL